MTGYIVSSHVLKIAKTIPTYLSTENLMPFFAQDTRNPETGRLEHIRRGPNGMDLVIKFLNSLDLVSLPLDRMNQKMENLLKELIELV